MSSTQYYELYRRSSVGTALEDTLDYLISNSLIEPQLAVKTLMRFDQVIADQLREQVKSRCTVRGHLHTYRCCDDVWTFVVKDVNFKMEDGIIENADKIKIVACNSRKAGES
ncbi:uncharacterized protein SAPINGB_P003123 [Magnusiomyces paraingens]|uniref:Transcription initiation factor IIA subunit 2 n=1 Tax=Magnusiomyces paraingens TaxID=2606893 RepID=A0A5E8BKS9_9ASCO|nr:uncharacterized protein SAPINGB_P003123 [Saprochaete ingens]VVT51519.1 unnamed protein product [Saprochaete ingens]